MFPNPQAALPLPPKPNLDRYRKLAKDLVKASKISASNESGLIRDWTTRWIKSLLGLQPLNKDFQRSASRKIAEVEGFVRRQLAARPVFRLADAQFVIARSHGFESWPKFSRHINELTKKTSATARYEAAVEAIVNGKVIALKKLMNEDPTLIHLRSEREHHATLLHYVSANGVEGYRQITPKNAVKIAQVLLKAGAEVDAEADMYGGGATALGLVATSVHPYLAGVQRELIQILLDHGAEIDHPRSGGNNQGAVLACLANGQPDAARYLAERGARLSLPAAAGVGRLDVVRSFFNKNGSRKQGTRKRDVEFAFISACAYGSNSVVQFLLDKGVKLDVKDAGDQTGSHWAVIGGQLETVKFLLKHKAPLELRNKYGGTVLGQAAWSAAHGGDTDLYAAIIEELIAAGAKVPKRHVPVNEKIDALLRKYGSEPEPAWHWYGEEPVKG